MKTCRRLVGSVGGPDLDLLGPEQGSGSGFGSGWIRISGFKNSKGLCVGACVVDDRATTVITPHSNSSIGFHGNLSCQSGGFFFVFFNLKIELCGKCSAAAGKVGLTCGW